MGAPRLEVLGHGVDDLRIEIEPEVVARGEIGEPLVTDADHATVDLVDHGVRHRVRPLELGEIAAGSEPPVDPRRGRSGRPSRRQGKEAARAHARTNRPRRTKALAESHNSYGTCDGGWGPRTRIGASPAWPGDARTCSGLAPGTPPIRLRCLPLATIRPFFAGRTRRSPAPSPSHIELNGSHPPCPGWGIPAPHETVCSGARRGPAVALRT